MIDYLNISISQIQNAYFKDRFNSVFCDSKWYFLSAFLKQEKKLSEGLCGIQAKQGNPHCCLLNRLVTLLFTALSSDSGISKRY